MGSEPRAQGRRSQQSANAGRHPGEQTITAQEEIFCAAVAQGISRKVAAESAGYSRSYAQQLAKRQTISRRIAELRSARSDGREGLEVSQAWIELQLVDLFRRAMNPAPTYKAPPRKAGKVDLAEGQESPTLIAIPEPPDILRAESVLMNLARLKGYLVERREVDSRSVTVNWSQRTTPELHKALEERLGRLPESQRERVRALASGILPQGPVTLSEDVNDLQP